ncbi:MAG: HWE histidine kinase domain-containing protein [Paracoccaceae bacterium]
MTDDPVDLTNCDREPIHIPGSIQPHGCLLACDAAAQEVLRHSANAREMLGLSFDPNGRLLGDVLGPAGTHSLRNTLSYTAEGQRPALLFALHLPGGVFDVTVHRHLGHAILEFEPAGSDPGATLSLARTVIGRMRALTTADRLVQRSAGLLQALMGYDRVMIYELGSDGAGKVVAEAKQPHLESFRGQYFPATDIPQQARALYLQNPIRLIGQVDFTPVPLVPVRDPSGEALDLSHSHLRSVSPVHCEYLHNMGVGASMSISVIIEGQLWGLIACHHYSPRLLSMAERAAAEMVGEFFSLHLDTLNRKQALHAANAARRALDDLLVGASRSEDIGLALDESLPKLADLITCDGVALWFDGKWSGTGLHPPASEALPLVRFAETLAEGQVWGTHQLSHVLPDSADLTAQVAGVIVIPVSQRPRDFLFFLRREAIHTLDWAGDPVKTYEAGPLGDRLTPRKSFAIWKETVRGKSLRWTDADRQFAEAIRLAIVEIVLRNSELLADERAKAAVRQRMLNEELNHRVKNILAVIRALVGRQPQKGETLRDYVETLRGRIQALAVAHDQVARGDGGGQLCDLLKAELGPYDGGTNRIVTEGPPVWLEARAFSVMALIMHEMATNAAKYGALSRRGGQVHIRWMMDGTGACVIDWRESGGPPVSTPVRTGFGSVLIDRSVPFDLGGRSRVDYNPGGLQAHFVIPARFARETALRPPPAPAAQTDATGQARTISERKVLIVEDQMLIAMALEMAFQDEGLTVTGVAPNVATALDLLDRDPPDMAVLDINLGTELSFPVAHRLRDRGIPFVFATGYGTGFTLPEALADAPVVGKPYDAAEILRKLRLISAANAAG